MGEDTTWIEGSLKKRNKEVEKREKRGTSKQIPPHLISMVS